jgi:hypothetical protein
MNKRNLIILTAVLSVVLVASLLAAQTRSKGEQESKRDAKLEKEEPLLDAIGSLSASHLVQTYLNIGMIADGRAGGVYDTPSAQQLLTTIQVLVASVDKRLQELAKGEMRREDKQALEKVVKQAVLLKEMATALQTFWKSGKKEDGAKYETLRKKAWAGIQQLAPED